MSIDFRKCLYALSDVIINRPPPLRLFDQIYMKLPDMLLQAELVGRWFNGKSVVFVGDGDAIALVLVLDFDQRITNSVNLFAEHYNLTDVIEAELYNVADPLPPRHWQGHDAF